MLPNLFFLLVAAVYPYITLALPASAHNKRSLVQRDGVLYNVFEHGTTGAKIEFIKNSGICEMTPGVNQYSGYLSVGEGKDMWFW